MCIWFRSNKRGGIFSFYGINTAKSHDLPYWIFEHFDLDNLADDACKAEFRYYKNDIYRQYSGKKVIL